MDDRDPLHPRPYIIECCAFWSFSLKSALSLMLTASGLAFERIVLDMWREKALSREAAAALVSRDGLGTVLANTSTVVKTASQRPWIHHLGIIIGKNPN